MKHAGRKALASIELLLKTLRRSRQLKERKLGVFYSKSKPFIHFHEDPAGVFAHMRTETGWKRMRVSGSKEVAAFVAAVASELKRKPL